MKQKKSKLMYMWSKIVLVCVLLLFVGQAISVPASISAAVKNNDLIWLNLTVGQSKLLKISGVTNKKIKWSS